MKKLFYLTLLFPFSVYAIEPEVLIKQQQEKIHRLELQSKQQKIDSQKQIAQLKIVQTKLKNLETQAVNFQQKFATLSGETAKKITDVSIATNQQLTEMSQNLSGLSQQTEQLQTENQAHYSGLDNRLVGLNDKITETQSGFSQLFGQYWNYLVGGLGGLLLLLSGSFLLLSKRLKHQQNNTERLIKHTRMSLEEEGIKLDEKLISLLESRLRVQETQSLNAESDHSLALKVADEIIRIQKNLGQMDPSVKGLKQLNGSVKRIQDNFAAQGYELIDMLGLEYHEGMKVSANFIPSDTLETGKQIITRIIKPQVNFKGEMIQAAQIEVSVGE